MQLTAHAHSPAMVDPRCTLMVLTLVVYITASIGAGLTHSEPLMVIYHLIQQSAQLVIRIFPLKEILTDELLDVLLKRQVVASSVPSSIPPPVMGMAQCDH